MVKCVVIADEITGASSVGSMLEKNRCSVCSIMSSKGIKNMQTANFDCFVYSTNSRNLTQEQSYQLVYYAGKLLKSPEVKLYAKRIDPSMRGNCCAETQAMLDSIGDENTIAMIVPAFPSLKRSNVGGYILVDGKVLQKSLAGMEDLFVSHTAKVADLFAQKFKYKSVPIHLKDLMQGSDYLADKIRQCASNGARAIVFDCISQEDINLIADAILKSNIKFLAVDPGPFTATVARKVMAKSDLNKTQGIPKIFGMVGGANPLISAQVEVLRLEEKSAFINVNTICLIDDSQKRHEEINRVVNEIIKAYEQYNVAFVISDHIGANNQQLSAFNDYLKRTNRSKYEALDTISTAYGQIAKMVLQKQPEVNALYATGAEFTVAVLREIKSLGLNILGQVLPLTAYGTIIGGEYEGLKFVTSASSATNTNTLVDSVQYLKRKLIL